MQFDKICSSIAVYEKVGWSGERLTAAASVGRGFTYASATTLRKQLDRLKAASPPAQGVSKKGVVWVKPKLAAEIAYRGWTHDDKLRHASFKGLREKADEATVYRLR